jgi:hypothetical protein
MDNGRPSNNQIASIVRAKVGAKVDAGTLPLAGNGRSMAIRGAGRACSACDEPIAPPDMELETTLDDNDKVMRFHLECFAAWWTVTWSRRGVVAI